ncbi:MAG: C-GCAxxG-C-C family protein [Clostridiales bacterium]|nr:C-GCAxxG-C-C family protein [Clostridiales bacterium]MDR2711879.1 C-GCAxxG-C-C family protein [Clostridiales bacterium]
MSKDINYLHQLLQNGHCCSMALIAVGLRHKGSENPEMLDAMRALCGGLSSGLICGALSGAACMITLLMPRAAENGGLLELVEWFDSVYGDLYGGINCRDILSERQSSMICPQITEETYKQAKMILSDHGYIFEEEKE